MPRWVVPLLIASAIIFILEYYAFQAVKTEPIVSFSILNFMICAFSMISQIYKIHNNQ